MTLIKGNTIYVDDVVTKGVVRDIRAYNGDLVTAVSDIGNQEVTLLISQPVTLNQDLTIPENICLKFLKGCSITVGTKSETTETVGTGDGSTTSFNYTVTDSPIARKSVAITYTINGTEYTANDNGVGTISGTDLSGNVDYQNGNISLTFSTAPDDGTDITITYKPAYLLTIDGSIEAGLWQVFDGDGEVTGNPKIEAVYPEWFGAVGDGEHHDTEAIQKAIDFGCTLLSRKYRVSSLFTSENIVLIGVNNNVELVMSEPLKIYPHCKIIGIKFNFPNSDGFIISGSSEFSRKPFDFLVKDIELNGSGYNKAIRITDVDGPVVWLNFNNIRITNWEHGLYVVSTNSYINQNRFYNLMFDSGVKKFIYLENNGGVINQNSFSMKGQASDDVVVVDASGVNYNDFDIHVSDLNTSNGISINGIGNRITGVYAYACENISENNVIIQHDSGKQRVEATHAWFSSVVLKNAPTYTNTGTFTLNVKANSLFKIDGGILTNIEEGRGGQIVLLIAVNQFVINDSGNIRLNNNGVSMYVNQGQIVVLVYDGEYWDVLNPVGYGAESVVTNEYAPDGYLKLQRVDGQVVYVPYRLEP